MPIGIGGTLAMTSILNLVWAQYSTPPKLYLLLYLGEEGNYIYAIKADSIPEEEISLIRKNITKLKTKYQNNLFSWLKENTPISYKKFFRKYKKNDLKILKEYPISS